ncbi:hypothetical protein ACFQ8C_12310 [Streptomyces sp. NPDC056503]|uniref:hypothetical protein n=1 Tax=Streptomyces sp. NPDC056503 TaxID=3345842 RepID=UPI003674C4D7
MLRYANTARRQDTIRDNRPRPNRLDPYKPYQGRRSAKGCTSVTRLYGEPAAEQAPVTYGMLRAHIATLRGAPPSHRRGRRRYGRRPAGSPATPPP